MTDGQWTDISVPIKAGIIVYPGDPAVRTAQVQDLDRGDSATVTTISMCVHSGTHIDAPRHFIQGGPTIDSMPFAAVNGRARIIAITGSKSITVAELEPHDIHTGEIILFKTRNSALWKSGVFHEDYVYLSTDAAAYLVEKRVRAVGIDYLSVGGYEKNEVACHRTLLEASIWIVESLDLSTVEQGLYDLACLPLRLEGCEAAPARAFVRRVG